MLIEAGKDFDAKYPEPTGEEAVDNALASGKISYATSGRGGAPACPPPSGVVDEPKYDPFDPKSEDLVIPHQPAIAVYENTSGAVVIIQCAADQYEEDSIILGSEQKARADAPAGH